MRTTITTCLFLVSTLMSGCLLLVPPLPCGDGILNEDIEEECDDGNNIDADGCEADCTLPVCENLIEDPGEFCHAGIGDTDQDPIEINAGVAATALAAGDIDNDGFQDLVVINADEATPFIGDGEGDFAAGAPINLTFNIAAAGLADLDGDGNLDLAVVNAIDQVRIALGDGNGNFDANNFITIDTGNNVAKIAFADLNGDGDVDIVTTNGATITIIINPGDIAAAAPIDLIVGDSPSETAIADIDGDGSPDLIVSDANALALNVLFNNGNGDFNGLQAQPFNVGAAQLSVAAGDFNNDGEIDVVAGLLGLAEVAVLLNDGGELGAPQTFTVGINPVAIAVADLDIDGDADIATADNGADQLSVLISNGDDDFVTETLAGQGATNAVIAVNINEDNIPDLINTAPGLNRVTVLLTFP